MALTGLAVAGLAGWPAAAEAPALQFSDEASVAWVLVPVTVRGTDGWVKDLARHEFRLLLDGQPVPIESFEAGVRAPLSWIHLQDLSGSMANGRKLEASRRALDWFLDQAQPGDEIALASFASGRVWLEVPFTTEPASVAARLDRWQGWGTTALHDAVAWLPEIQAHGRHAKRAAILVTDGLDNASAVDPLAARRLIHQAELPIFVLGLRAAANRRVADDASGLLRELAASSGGRYFELDAGISEQGLITTCERIASELRYQYVLGFQTQDRGHSAYRTLRVEVDRPDLDVHHRRGYEGPLPGFLAPVAQGP